MGDDPILQMLLARPDATRVALPAQRPVPSIGPAGPPVPQYVPSASQRVQRGIDVVQDGLGIINPGVELAQAGMDGDLITALLVGAGTLGTLGRVWRGFRRAPKGKVHSIYDFTEEQLAEEAARQAARRPQLYPVQTTLEEIKAEAHRKAMRETVF